MRALILALLAMTGCSRAWLAITQPEKYGTAYQRKNWAEAAACRTECADHLRATGAMVSDTELLVLVTPARANGKDYDRCTCEVMRDPLGGHVSPHAYGRGEFYVEHKK